MKKHAVLFVMLVSIFTMLPGNTFAEDDKVSLDEAIKILQILAGGDPPPAFNATGTWAVQSAPEGITRYGEVFLNMSSDGDVTGYAELTSLSGLSSVKGHVHGLSFDLEMTSGYGSIVVHGLATEDGQNINGTFYNKANENFVIQWEGSRQQAVTQEGTYVYDSQQNILSLTFGVGIPQEFTVSDFTETTVNLNNTTWNRNNPGDVGDIVGIWRNVDGSIETVMTFDVSGNFSYIQKQLD